MTKTEKSKQNVEFERLANNMPTDVAASFSEDQKAAIKVALTTSEPSRHKIDIRHSFSILRRKYYVVFLFGKDRRTRRRLRAAKYRRRNSGISHVISTGMAATLVCTALASTAYLVTSLLNINLIPQRQVDNFLFSTLPNAVETK